jgi:tRNA pseudouridine-54 N-methylase
MLGTEAMDVVCTAVKNSLYSALNLRFSLVVFLTFKVEELLRKPKEKYPTIAVSL